nr:ATP-binding protein [Acetatifactor muris]
MELLIGAGISVETEGDFTVYSDEKSLCFILKQLLVNCAKYCPGCHIRIRAEEGVISVWDNGPGIPAHELHRVTERGFTGSVGRAAPLWRSEGKEDIAADAGNPGRGTGMGLYIVKELCDRLGITMEITSEEGAFTCVALGYDSRA